MTSVLPITMVPKVVFTDIRAPKLTLSPTRFEIKMPSSYNTAETSRAIDFAENVLKELGTPTQSLRGAIYERDGMLAVDLKRDNKEVVFSFYESEEGT